jgi:hypothetical protein
LVISGLRPPPATGAYAGANGVLHTVSRGQNSPYRDDTLHLILPT